MISQLHVVCQSINTRLSSTVQGQTRANVNTVHSRSVTAPTDPFSKAILPNSATEKHGLFTFVLRGATERSASQLAALLVVVFVVRVVTVVRIHAACRFSPWQIAISKPIRGALYRGSTAKLHSPTCPLWPQPHGPFTGN